MLALALLTVALSGLQVAAAVYDPFFPGDSGYRLHSAHYPVAIMGNRIWLPFLQVQIWFFYLLHLPYFAFRLIPCLYFLAAMLFLGLLTYRITGPSVSGFLFTLLLVFCFAHQLAIESLSTSLYQEPIDLACFYVLLWAGALGLRRNKWLLPLAAVSLLVRETFWIYLFTLSLLNWRKIQSEKSYRLSFLFLWTVPTLWILSIPLEYRFVQGRFPASPVEWPLGINKEEGHAVAHVLPALKSVLDAVISSRAAYLAGGLIIAWAIGAVQKSTAQPSAVSPDPFRVQFRRFSLISLAIIYALIVLFDPWEHTFANHRMAVPLLAHAFVWAGVLFADADGYVASARALARGILIVALLLSMSLDVATWIPQWNAQANRDVAEIADLVKTAGRDKMPTVCIIGEGYFPALERLVAPTLYARRFLLGGRIVPEGCDLAITPSDYSIIPRADLIRVKDYQLRGRSYAVFQRRAEPPHG